MLPRPAINFERTPVTLIVAAVAVALQLVFEIRPDLALPYYNDWLGILPSIWRGQLWRPFTTCLMHGDLLHAAFNVYWLVVFGPALETRFGSYRFLGLVIVLGYVSMMPEYCIGSYHRHDPVRIVGLSGIVYGLFGVLYLGRRRHPEFEAVCDSTTSTLLLGWFVFCIVATRVGLMNVANIAHGAGFAFGLLYAAAAFEARRRRLWIGLAVGATLLVLGALIACPGHAQYEWVRRHGAHWLLSQDRTHGRDFGARADFGSLEGGPALSGPRRYAHRDRWTWMFRQLPSASRCHTRVSEKHSVAGLPPSSICCDMRT